MDENKAGKYLTFKLAAEDNGISLLKVREIIGMMTIASVPRTPEYVKGVINLRSKVDTHYILGMANMEEEPHSVSKSRGLRVGVPFLALSPSSHAKASGMFRKISEQQPAHSALMQNMRPMA